MNILKFVFFPLFLLFSQVSFVHAQTATWNGSSNNSWDNPGNWTFADGGALSNPATSYSIPSASRYPISNFSPVMTMKKLEISADASPIIPLGFTLVIDGSVGDGLNNFGSLLNQGTINIDNITGGGADGVQNKGTFINEGTIDIDNVRNSNGIRNEGIISNLGIIHIDGTRRDGIINTRGGLIENSFIINIGATGDIGDEGISNYVTFNNLADGIIRIYNSNSTGLYNSNGSFSNSGLVSIGQGGTSGDIGGKGLWNEFAIFSNNATGKLRIDNCSSEGVLVNAETTFASIGEVYIGTTGAANNIGAQGVTVLGTLENLAPGVMEIANTLEENVLTQDGGIFNNTGTVDLAADLSINEGGLVIGSGLYQIGGNWTNDGTFTPGNSTVRLQGSSAAAILGSVATTFNELEIQKDDQNGVVTAQISLSTLGKLSVNNSHLITLPSVTINTTDFEINPFSRLTHTGRINATNFLSLNGLINGAGIYDSQFGFVIGSTAVVAPEDNATVILSGPGNAVFADLGNEEINNFIIDKASPMAQVDVEGGFSSRNFTLRSGILVHDELISAENVLIEQDGTWQATSSLVVRKDLTNNGQFTGAPGSVLRLVTAETGTISGNPFTVDQLWMIMPVNSAEVSLNTNLTVSSRVNFRVANLGNLRIGSRIRLTLATGAVIENESDAGYIYGPGNVETTVPLIAPSAVNPGNLGLEISSFANLGSTLIRRYHPTNPIGGENTIARSYQIIPTNNSDLDASLKFYYLDHELNNIEEERLAPFQFNGLEWELGEATENNTTDNYVAFSNIDTLSDWTLVEGPPDNLLARIKVILAGTYNPVSGLMNDDLRTQELIPINSPYPTSETIIPSVLTVSGNDAVVDWVLVELRSALDRTEVIHTRAALLQRDGDVVDVDGISPVAFPEVEAGDYYVAVRHRNHLAVMTQNAVPLE